MTKIVDSEQWTGRSDSPFKKPEELGLTEEQFCALVAVMGGLQAGKLTHNPKIDTRVRHGFNMGVWQNRYDCGTTCCIGGWAAMKMGVPATVFSSLSSERGMRGLYGLFYGDTAPDVTPEMGARAIGNYLRTGTPQWHEVRKWAKSKR